MAKKILSSSPDQNSNPEKQFSSLSAPVEVRDAFDEALRTTHGLDGICSCIAASDEGIGPSAGSVLVGVTQRLVDLMETVNAYFNSQDEEK